MSTRVRQRPKTGGAPIVEVRGELAPRSSLRRIPSSRALVGGLLIALAAGGVFIAHRGANAAPSTRYLVVTEPVQVGTALSERHLGSVAVALPDDLSAVRAEQVETVLGRVVRTPLEPLDLLRSADLYESGRFATASSVEVAVDLPPARALGGVVQVGSVVDVLATDPSGTGTLTIATSVAVVGVGSDARDEIGGRGSTRIRLSLPSADVAEVVVDAAVRSEVTLTLPAPRSSAPEPNGSGS